MKKLYQNFIFALIFSLNVISSYGQLPDFTLTVTSTDETCNRNGMLSFTVSGTHPNANIIYTIYKLPNTTSPYATVSTNTLSGLVGGTYRVIATQTLGTESNSKQQDAVINSTVTALQFNMTYSDIPCSLNRNINVIVTSGNPTGYEIIAGPVIKPRQPSNVFTNLVAGNYLIKVYDSCGNAVTRSYTLVTPESISNPLAISEHLVPDSELSACSSVGVRHVLSVDPDYIINYPLTIVYTIYPPGGGAPIIRTFTINRIEDFTSFDLTSNPNTYVFEADLPYYDQPYSYNLLITDACGNQFQKESNQVTEMYEASIQTQINNCGIKTFSVKASNFVYPITVQFLSAPAGFNPNLYNPSHPTFFSDPTYGNTTNILPEGSYLVRVTDACGRTDTAEVNIVHETTAEVTATGSCGASGTISGEILGSDIVSATIQIAPSDFAFPTPYNVNAYIQPDGTIFISGILVPGQYTIILYDDCGNSYTKPITVPPASSNVPRVNYLGGCAPGFGSVYIGGAQDVQLLDAEFITVPSTYSGPMNVSSNIRGAYFMMSSLPVGTYRIKIKDSCNSEYILTLQIKEYIGNTTFEIVEGCSSFNFKINHTNNNGSFPNLGYWLQKFNPVTGQWGHPNTNVAYPENTTPNGNNSITIANNAWNLNLAIGGRFRVLTASSIYGSVGVSSNCLFVIKEFETGSLPEIKGALNFSCSGTLSDVLLNVEGEGNYAFSIIKKNDVPFDFSNGNSPLFTDLESAVYVFQIVDECQNTSTYTHDVTTPFVFSIAATLCDGQNSSLSVPNFPYLQYRWYKQGAENITLSTNASLNFNPLNVSTNSGIYHVAVTYPAEPDSCLNQTLSYEINAGTQPNAGEDNTVNICDIPPSINLFDYLLGNADRNGTWEQITPVGTLSANVWSTEGAQQGSTYYFSYVVNGFCGVEDEAIIAIHFLNILPTPIINSIGPVCVGAPISLRIQNPNILYHYVWSGPNGFTATGIAPIFPNATVAMSGTYSVTANLVNCPSQPVTFELVVTPLPEFHFANENNRICSGQEISLKVVPDNFNELQASYLWSNEAGEVIGGNFAEVEVNEPGLYNVLVDVDGCTFSKAIEVEENTDTFSVGAEAKCEDDHYMLSAYAIDNSFNESTASYVWTGPNNFYATTQSTDITGLESGTYTVVVTNEEGCSETISIPVEKSYCKIPKGVSPNGDNDNDTWNLAGLDILRVKIFNRYGMEVYEMNNYVNQWHGQCSDGKLLPTATYYYYISFRSGKEKTGWVYLNREVH
ncbi:gliding motility-associated C-terminal domain-containing protein [Flavobacterium sp. WW92]|uniref:gliding motility-associated C-terminal domain-containing protein n=1 Tax=unclassified Flavobacterium TaxID=196869 RepID=UPI0022243137|nr:MULTISPECIES: gliding motility-associated C-terminal domain-containing protein [unclassified Flavobacterium]WDO14346.1 gliding motility-associated C-terminal domain-containing protein [Flavobacterium sp. WW92]